jgi:signal transduction histidine kinase
MRIRTLLIAGTVVWAATGAGVGGGLYTTFQDLNAALHKDRVARDIGRGVFELTLLTGDYLLHHEIRAQTQWQRKHETLGRLLEEAGFEPAGGESTLAVLRAAHLAINDAFAGLVAAFAARRAQGADAGQSRALEQRLVTVILTKSQTMGADAFRLASRSEAEVADAARRAQGFVILLIVIIVIMVTGTWIVFARRVVGPIRELHRGIGIVGGGDLDHRLGTRGRDEIAEVGSSLDEMTEKLKTTLVSRDELAKEVTERKRAEETLRRARDELAAANQELEAFAYTVSHDLRAPLRGMDGFSQAVVEDYGDKLDEQGRDYLARIRSASQRMAQLIDDILTLSRATRTELEREPVDLSEMARSIAASLSKTEPARQVSFNIAPNVVAHGDARLLRGIMENLLGNAWKFSRNNAQACIEFGATENDGKMAFFVRDNGAGFDPAYAHKLFQPFQRLHSTSEFEGTGIGLATVARIARRHGGTAWAESKVDQGATIYFTL